MSSQIERFLTEPEKESAKLWELTREASHRLSSRVFIDDNNLPMVDLPLGGEDGLEQILSFVPKAKEGFALDLRSEGISILEEEGLLEYTVPITLLDYSHDLKEAGIRLKRYLVKEGGRVAVFRYAFVTLVTLSNSQEYTDTSGTSEWPYRPTREVVWNLLNEIEVATYEMIFKENLNIQKKSAVRAVHFFKACSKFLKR